MKALKMKIIDELKKYEHRASVTEGSIRKNELDEVYRLAKTLCYLEKVEAVMNGNGKAVI